MESHARAEGTDLRQVGSLVRFGMWLRLFGAWGGTTDGVGAVTRYDIVDLKRGFRVALAIYRADGPSVRILSNKSDE